MKRWWQSSRLLVAGAVLVVAGSVTAMRTVGEQRPASPAQSVVVYKDPNCGCCALWGKHMEQAGFSVRYVDSADMPAIRTKYQVPSTMQACHTAVVDGYVVEGHVPAADVKKLLASRPKVLGIAVPGMPIGSPGMEQGGRTQSYATLSFDAAGKATIFAEH